METGDNNNNNNNPDEFSKRWVGVAFLECVVLGFFVVKVMINKFISFKNTPLFMYASIFLGYFLSASIVFLIPIDISNVKKEQSIPPTFFVSIYKPLAYRQRTENALRVTPGPARSRSSTSPKQSSPSCGTGSTGRRSRCAGSSIRSSRGTPPPGSSPSARSSAAASTATCASTPSAASWGSSPS